MYAVDIKILTIEKTPLKKIEPHTFLGVNKTLEQLYLEETELEVFPAHAFEVFQFSSNIGIIKNVCARRCLRVDLRT